MRARNGMFLFLFSSVVVAACSDGPTETATPMRPAMVQVATPGFTFLSPLIENADPAGRFNPDLEPVLEVCGDALPTCARVLTTGDLKTGIAIDLQAPSYRALWSFTESSTEYPAGTYRLTVFTGPAAGAAALGYVDVVFDGVGVKATDGREISADGLFFVPFFIARGLLCSTRESDNPLGEPCLETTVGPEGGTFTVDTKLAGVYFPPGALSETVLLVIERYEPPSGPGEPPTDYACIPVTHPQYEGCYVYRTEPKVPQFNLEVVVGVCPELSALELEPELELWKWDEVEGSEVQELPRRNVEFLECPGYDELGSSGTGPLSWGQRLLRPLARLMLPSPLHARKISPFGGGLNDFSRIGWVRPLALEVIEGDAQEGPVGDALPVNPKVRVVANGEKVAGSGIGVPGVTVAFTPAAGSGTADPATAVTDASGYASTSWQLGSEGSNSLTVNGDNPLAGFPNVAGTWSSAPHAAPAVFTATGVLPPAPYEVVFTSPLAGGKLPKESSNVSGVPVRVESCSITSGDCWLARQVTASGSYHFQLSLPADAPTGEYTFTVYQGSVPLSTFSGAVAKKGGSEKPQGVDFTFQLNSTIPIKFYLIAR